MTRRACLLLFTLSTLFVGHVVSSKVRSISSRGHTVSSGVLRLSAASFRFSEKLFKEIAHHKKTFVYSPFRFPALTAIDQHLDHTGVEDPEFRAGAEGVAFPNVRNIHSSLTLIYNGARHETASQMAHTLELTLQPGSRLNHDYHELIAELTSSKTVKLLTATALLNNPQYDMNPSFTKMAKKTYCSETFSLNLATLNEVEKAVNNFIANKTHQVIRNVISKGTISKRTSLLSVSALFFNGSWAKSFDRRKTRKKTFHVKRGVRHKVDMMRTDGSFPFKECPALEARVLELPFVDRRFGLFLVLPQALGGIATLETRLSTSLHKSKLFEGLVPTDLHVQVPKFQIESGLLLKRSLHNLGMLQVFQSSKADLGGISKPGPYITEVKHIAVVKVMESGTVASSVTLSFVQSKSIRVRPSKHFIANHPFIFFLRDRLTQTILFHGKFSGST